MLKSWARCRAPKSIKIINFQVQFGSKPSYLLFRQSFAPEEDPLLVRHRVTSVDVLLPRLHFLVRRAKCLVGLHYWRCSGARHLFCRLFGKFPAAFDSLDSAVCLLALSEANSVNISWASSFSPYVVANLSVKRHSIPFCFPFSPLNSILSFCVFNFHAECGDWQQQRLWQTSDES